jgi:hypothetical protein
MPSGKMTALAQVQTKDTGSFRDVGRRHAHVDLEPFTFGDDVKGTFAIDDDGANIHPKPPAVRAGGKFSAKFCHATPELEKEWLEQFPALSLDAPTLKGTIDGATPQALSVVIDVNHAFGEPFVERVLLVPEADVACAHKRDHDGIQLDTVVWKAFEGLPQYAGVRVWTGNMSTGVDMGGWVQIDGDAWSKDASKVKGRLSAATVHDAGHHVELSGKFEAVLCHVGTP